MSVASDAYLDEESQAKISELTSLAENGNLSGEDANTAANDIRNSVSAGYTATAQGNTVWDTDSNGGNSSAKTVETPTYVSQYQSQIDSILEQLNNGTFADFTAGDDYAALEKSYTQAGQTAMQDTLGQIASRTGGMASSYAGTASQQTYNNYMEQLESIARDMYSSQRSDNMDMLGVLSGLEASDYSKYRDQVSDYNYNNEWAYGVGRDQVADERYDQEWAYGVGRDEVADKQYADQQAQAQKESIADTMAGIGDFSGLSDLGYSDAQIAALSAAWKEAQAAKTTVSSGSGSGGSAVDDYEGLYAAAKASGNAANYIAQYYSDYGFTKSTGLTDGYKEWVQSGSTTGDSLYTTEFDTMVSYAQKVLDNGKSVEELDAALLNIGYSADVIDQIFGALGL